MPGYKLRRKASRNGYSSGGSRFAFIPFFQPSQPGWLFAFGRAGGTGFRPAWKDSGAGKGIAVKPTQAQAELQFIAGAFWLAGHVSHFEFLKEQAYIDA